MHIQSAETFNQPVRNTMIMENAARKINLDLFLTDRCNENISPEYQKAYDKLASLPELTDISIDSFLSELRERWDLLCPVLGEQTKDFLGYCKGDIETIQNFFTADHFDGIDALSVQAALRAIWLKTPCTDNRLNFDLFKCVDDKFYGIIWNLERSFSLSTIPSILPEKFQDMISLETLNWIG